MHLFHKVKGQEGNGETLKENDNKKLSHVS